VTGGRKVLPKELELRMIKTPSVILPLVQTFFLIVICCLSGCISLSTGILAVASAPGAMIYTKGSVIAVAKEPAVELLQVGPEREDRLQRRYEAFALEVQFLTHAGREVRTSVAVGEFAYYEVGDPVYLFYSESDPQKVTTRDPTLIRSQFLSVAFGSGVTLLFCFLLLLEGKRFSKCLHKERLSLNASSGRLVDLLVMPKINLHLLERYIIEELKGLGASGVSLLGMTFSIFLFGGLLFGMGVTIFGFLNFELNRNTLHTIASITRVVKDNKTDILFASDGKKVRTYPVDRIYFVYKVENGEEVAGKAIIDSKKYEVGDELILNYSPSAYHIFTLGDVRGGYKTLSLVALGCFVLCFLLTRCIRFLVLKVAPLFEKTDEASGEESVALKGDKIFEGL